MSKRHKGKRRHKRKQQQNENLHIDAAEGHQGRRRRISARIQSLDDKLTPQKRSKVNATTRYLDENFAVAAWAIRRHLDYVSMFNFQARSGDEGLDEELGEMVKEWSSPKGWDAGRRHGRNMFMRIAEGRSVIDGDIGVAQIEDGRVQGIESDRIRNQHDRTHSRDRRARQDQPAWHHGVRTGPAGRALEYSVHRRSRNGGYEWERNISANQMHLVGYFTGFDQVRGASPMIAAINSYQDVYESLDLALVKQKVAQILALVTYRDDGGDMGHQSSVDSPGSEIDFSSGPVHLNFEVNEKAEILESNNPGGETQKFWQTVIQIALKSLDLPFSFYDESFTNFFGSRAAFIHYERSARVKRERLEYLLDELTKWRLAMWVLDRELRLPRTIPLSSIRWHWAPLGVDWWNPVQEMTADLMGIEAGIMTRAEVRKRRFGDDWRPVAAALGEEQRVLSDHKVQTSFASKTQALEMINAGNDD